MAREFNPEPGLPSPEQRRQILDRAGLVLKQAQTLVAELDQREDFPQRLGWDYDELPIRQPIEALKPPLPRPLALASTAHHTLAE